MVCRGSPGWSLCARASSAIGPCTSTEKSQDFRSMNANTDLIPGPRENQGCICMAILHKVRFRLCTADVEHCPSHHINSFPIELWTLTCRNGGRIALGSDFPVESLDPLKGFYAATTRLSEKGTSPHGSDGWMAGEKLTREQALRGFTVDGELSFSPRCHIVARCLIA